MIPVKIKKLLDSTSLEDVKIACHLIKEQMDLSECQKQFTMYPLRVKLDKQDYFYFVVKDQRFNVSGYGASFLYKTFVTNHSIENEL